MVAVQCGINWGTGIIVCRKKGYILTCAHVVNEVKNKNANNNENKKDILQF